MRTNTAVKNNPIFTAEGAKATRINPELQLRRLVMSCMLWEDNFYVDGVTIAKLIEDTIPKVKPGVVAEIAIEAREKMKLRHMPLFIVKTMARLPTHRFLVAKTLERVIQRADELSEFLSMYWKEGRCTIAAQVKKGLANAFTKFNEYNLQKYNRDTKIKLKDVLFMVHAKPKDKEQADIWTRLIDNKLATPDTWEVRIADAKTNKQEEWSRLLAENKLGGLALIRNFNNFAKHGVDRKLIINAISNMNVERVLPFRFITAARYAPDLEPYLETAMFKCLEGIGKKLTGRTVLLVDVSGSMDDRISGRSETTRMDAACGLAVLARELCEDVTVYSFSQKLVKVASRRGFALRDAIVQSQSHSSTYLGSSVKYINQNDSAYDRLIVFTDEQSHDIVPDPLHKGYMCNVASNKNGVGYGKWTHIDGFSEAILDFIGEIEKVNTGR